MEEMREREQVFESDVLLNLEDEVLPNLFSEKPSSERDFQEAIGETIESSGGNEHDALPDLLSEETSSETSREWTDNTSNNDANESNRSSNASDREREETQERVTSNAKEVAIIAALLACNVATGIVPGSPLLAYYLFRRYYSKA